MGRRAQLAPAGRRLIIGCPLVVRASVVELHSPDGLEVEFVLASGKTQALVSLHHTDVRAVGEGDLIAVRDLKRTA